jgi:hypothetical protein
MPGSPCVEGMTKGSSLTLGAGSGVLILVLRAFEFAEPGVVSKASLNFMI